MFFVKMFHHIIWTHLENLLESKNLFTTVQQRLRKSLLCKTQLVSFIHDLHRYLDFESHTDWVFFYFSMAFKNISHLLLIHKLLALNIDPYVLDCVFNELFAVCHFQQQQFLVRVCWFWYAARLSNWCQVIPHLH